MTSLYWINHGPGYADMLQLTGSALRWRNNGRDDVSNHQPHDCLLNRLFKRRSKKTQKLRVTGLCAGNSPVTGEFPAQMAIYVESASNFYLPLIVNSHRWPQPQTINKINPLGPRPQFADEFSYACIELKLFNPTFEMPLPDVSQDLRNKNAPMVQIWRNDGLGYRRKNASFGLI